MQLIELLKMIIRFDVKNLFYTPTKNVWIQFFRYGFVGGIAFVVDAGSLYLIKIMGVHYLLATAFAFVIGLITNFLLSKAFVFNGNTTEKNRTTEFLVYAVIGVIGLGLTELIMYLFTEKVHLYFMVSKIIAAIIVLIWNFVGRKIILYKD